ncbi:MAG: RidA family protein, partial [Cytophagia bacterium]|nr:RidA family protein [Cytophagia bacterium]
MKKLMLLPLLFFVFICTAQSVDAEKKLKELGIELITPTKPMANYVKAVRTGNLIFLAGHGPSKADGTL